MRQLYTVLRRWFVRTFGAERDPYAIIIKLQEEINELNMCVQEYEQWQTLENKVKVQQEMADVMILMINLATNYNMCYDSFLDSIKIKHYKNTKRSWEKQDDGTFKHIDKDE